MYICMRATRARWEEEYNGNFVIINYGEVKCSILSFSLCNIEYILRIFNVVFLVILCVGVVVGFEVFIPKLT